VSLFKVTGGKQKLNNCWDDRRGWKADLNWKV